MSLKSVFLKWMSWKSTMPGLTVPKSALPKSTVVVPLYIYPVSEITWKPLFDSITAYPELDFIVIVNPNSGPGGAALPGDDYVREVPKLNSLANVRTVGYVHIDYCRRPLSKVGEDIGLYAGWNSNHTIPGLYVEGIYVDETPNHASRDTSEYLDQLSELIKGADGLLGDPLIIHNPGTPPEGALTLFGSPDLVCVCEEPYALYRSDPTQQRLRDYALDREHALFQLSGVPAAEMAGCVADLRGRARYVFATVLVDNFYESFGPGWMDFVAAVAGG